jgi:hypothetical protein
LRDKIRKKSGSGSKTKSEEEELKREVTKKDASLPEEFDREMEKIQRKCGKDDGEEKGIRKIHFFIMTDKDDIEWWTEKGEFGDVP